MDSFNSNTLPNPNTEGSLIFDEEELPVYYSQVAVYAFAFFFGPMFGSVLMAMNLSRTKRKRGMWQVLLFGLVLTLSIYWLASNATRSASGINLFCNLAGASGLRYFFWAHYIGNVNYKKRSVGIPIAIGLLIGAAIAAMTFYL